MREIKFRAWGGEEKKYFVYFSLLNQAKNYVESDYQEEDGSRHIHDKENIIDVQQYTGLKDKNGKEIYEGDILDEVCSLKGNFQVYWNKMQWDTKDGINHCVLYDVGKVIGNIYENPELIK